MKYKSANISVLLVIGLLFALLFFLFVVFGTNFGNRFGTLYERKLDQATAAKERKAILKVDPDPAKSAGISYKVTGSHFKAGTVVFLNLSDPVCCTSFAVSPDELGNITFVQETGKPGIYRVEAFQRNEQGLVLVATVFFEVTDQVQ